MCLYTHLEVCGMISTACCCCLCLCWVFLRSQHAQHTHKLAESIEWNGNNDDNDGVYNYTKRKKNQPESQNIFAINYDDDSVRRCFGFSFFFRNA